MIDFPVIDIRALLVPLASALRVETGRVDPDVVSDLETQGFDQAPVRDGEQWAGIVSTVHLRALADGGEAIEPDDPAISGHSVRVDEVSDVADLLRALESERAALVVDAAAGEPVGMVTISDLNRHAVRKALYDLLSEVESRLATLLAHVLDDELDALRHLGELDQIHLLGHYHFMKRGGVELSVLAGASLSQLLKIAREEAGVLDLLGYSKTQFKGETGSLPTLRNQVMHPVRPLVHKQDDVARVHRGVLRLAELRARLRDVLDAMPGAPLL